MHRYDPDNEIIDQIGRDRDALMEELDRLRAENAELREALKPFADVAKTILDALEDWEADGLDNTYHLAPPDPVDTPIEWRHFVRAHAVLDKTKGAG